MNRQSLSIFVISHSLEDLADTPDDSALSLYTPAGCTLRLYLGEVGGVYLIIGVVGAHPHECLNPS